MRKIMYLLLGSILFGGCYDKSEKAFLRRDLWIYSTAFDRVSVNGEVCLDEMENVREELKKGKLKIPSAWYKIADCKPYDLSEIK